jgi:hypothetical protein
MGAPIKRIGDLEINQDLAVQARMWKIQRIGWAAMGLIVLAGLIGSFGHGPISHGTAGGPDSGFMLEFDRLGRMHGPSELRFVLQPERDGRLSLWVSDSYLSQVEIHQIVPWPEAMVPVDGGVRFDWHNSGSSPARVVWSVEATGFGLMSGDFRSPGRPPVHLRQFMYP